MQKWGMRQTNWSDATSIPRLPIPATPAIPRQNTYFTQTNPNPQPNSSHSASTQDAKKNPKNLVNVIADLCKGCELCVHACPSQNLSMSSGLNAKGYHPAVFSYEGKKGPCTACGICYWICPDLAISEIMRPKQ